MTRNAETPHSPGAEESAPESAASPVGGIRTGQSGPVAELGLVAAGLGLVIYLIGFVTDLGGSSSLILPLLLGGGLLAGSVALPTAAGASSPPPPSPPPPGHCSCCVPLSTTAGARSPSARWC